MAGFDPATDPRVRDAVNWERSQRGLPPLGTPAAAAAATAAAPVNTFQALTPEEQALGAMQAEQQALVDAQVAANPAHGGYSAAPEPAPVSTAPGLDWMPPEQTAPPAAQMAATANPQPEVAPVRQPGQVRMGGGIANPLPSILADTTQRRVDEQAKTAGYEAKADEALAEQQVAIEDRGQAKADTATGIADVQDQAQKDMDEYIQRLGVLTEARDAASEKTATRMNEINQEMSTFEPKDRRSTTNRVLGALATVLSGLGDQANLAAGVYAGMNIQTDNAGKMMALIQRGIDRDLEQQRQLLENKRTAAAGMNTELGRIQEKFGSDIDSTKIAYAMKLDQHIAAAKEAEQRGLAGEALATSRELVAQLEQKRAEVLGSASAELAQKYLAQENQQRMMRYQQSLPRVQSEKERLDLESKRLANEKARRELEGGGPERKLNEGELKLKRDLEGLANGGVFERVYGYVARGDNPYVGVRGVGAMAPQIFTPSDNIRYKRDLLSLGMSVLRDKSGAAMPANEVEQELDRYGAFSGDPEVAREGVRQLLAEASSRAQAIGLKPKDIGLPSLDVRPE